MDQLRKSSRSVAHCMARLMVDREHMETVDACADLLSSYHKLYHEMARDVGDEETTSQFYCGLATYKWLTPIKESYAKLSDEAMLKRAGMDLRLSPAELKDKRLEDQSEKSNAAGLPTARVRLSEASEAPAAACCPPCSRPPWTPST